MFVYSKYSSIPERKRFTLPISRRGGLVLLVITTVLLAMLKLANWLNAQEVFTLKKIEVEGNRFVTEDEILKMVRLDATKSVFELDLKAIAQQLSKHPFIVKALVNRRLPDNLVIRVVEKEPLALLNTGTLSILDDHGNPLPNPLAFEPVDLPVISNMAVTGEHAADNMKHVIEFLNVTKESYFPLYSQLSEVSFSPRTGLYVYLMEGSVPVLFGQGNYAGKNEKLLEVLKIIQKDASSLSHVRMLDLRYKDQVIVKDLAS